MIDWSMTIDGSWVQDAEYNTLVEDELITNKVADDANLLLSMRSGGSET